MLEEQFVVYNYWANSELCSIVKNLKDGDFTKKVTSSFPTIEKTLLHVLDAETIWLLRLNGKSLSHWPSENSKANQHELVQLVNDKSAELKAFIQEKSADYFGTTCNFNDTKGNKYSILVRDIVHHVCNHSTFHRGQMVTMLRQLNYTNIPSTDYITWVRKGKPN